MKIDRLPLEEKNGFKNINFGINFMDDSNSWIETILKLKEKKEQEAPLEITNEESNNN
jgi:hypothetical protein